MATKDQNTRLVDTVEYLKGVITAAQVQEVVNLINNKSDTDYFALSDDLSIKHSNPFTASARRAKRALMLLASLFIENAHYRQTEVARTKNLPDSKEDDLKKEIRSWFATAGVTGDVIAAAARVSQAQMAKWNNVNLDASHAIRGVFNKTHDFNCYNACVFWAFQAGAISKRYYWNKLQGNDGNAFYPIYELPGWTSLTEATGVPAVYTVDVSNGGEFTGIPAGRTIYFETPTKKFGHVAMSLGDGTVISQNSIYTHDPALVRPLYQGEVTKMTQGVTHILSIREMLNIYFHTKNGYPKILVSNAMFFEPIPFNER
jgi:hypothetical protein